MKCEVCPNEIAGTSRRRYCSRACQQAAYRRRHGVPESRSVMRRRALLEATRLRDSDEGAVLTDAGFDLPLIVAGLER